MAEDPKKPENEEYKGTSSTMAMLGGRAGLDGMVGTIAGAAISVGAGLYTKKDPATITKWASYASSGGFIAGFINGGVVDTRNAKNAESQFAANTEELKTLRAEKKSFLETLQKEKAEPAETKTSPKAPAR